ncbi:cytochrome c3 family protein [Vibrio barjaei]|uniref:Cytochrome c3 family protein n=1 Tax=Vibrio barjaei TaxID=1676683 RepID=A0ABW7IET4_9VIBR
MEHFLPVHIVKAHRKQCNQCHQPHGSAPDKATTPRS